MSRVPGGARRRPLVRYARLSEGRLLTEVVSMPGKKHGNVKNPKQYEGLRDKGMSKERAAKIANSPGASKRGG